MRAIDTNSLIRLLIEDDPKQTILAESFVERGAFVGLVVLAETVWVLRTGYGAAHKQIAETVEMLLSQDRLSLEDPETVSSALKLFRENPRIDFADCLILETARKAANLPLGTFDRALAKIDGTERIG